MTEYHVSFPIARDVPFRTIPFRTIPRRHSTSRVADDTNSHMRVHTYEFVCDESTNTNLYVIDQSYEKKLKFCAMIRIHTCKFTHTNLCVINQPIRIRM
jgi:hypothetical protein